MNSFVLPSLFRFTALAVLFSLLPVLSPQRGHSETDQDGVSLPLLQIQRFPGYFHSRSPLTPTAEITLRFSGPVSVKDIREAVSFVDRKTGRLVTVKVRRPKKGVIEDLQPWGDDDKRLQWPSEHFVVVTPKSPLPTDVSWQLRVDPLISSDGKQELRSPWINQLGTLSTFKVNSIRGINRYDEPHYVQISLSKSLHEDVDDRTLASQILVAPKPANYEIVRSGTSVLLKGDYRMGTKYQVTVFGGLLARDETRIQGDRKVEVVFSHREGFVSLPAFARAQSAAGAKQFEILTGNLKDLRVRIKQLDREDLAYAMRGYQKVYTGYGDQQTIPFAMVPGQTIYDQKHSRTAEIDHSEKLRFDWDEILEGKSHAALYLCAEGWSETQKSLGVGAQALIQLTDLGLAWKRERDSLLVYTFSLKSGKPLGNVTLETLGKEAEVTGSFETDANGLATLPRKPFDAAEWLCASKDGDRHLMQTFGRYDAIRLWQFSVPYRYDEVEETERRTLLFTDRGVYRPGETVHLKCLSRLTDNDQLLPMAQAAGKAKVRVTDSKGRTVFSSEEELSESGGFDIGFDIPADNALGYYSVLVDFNDPKKEVRNAYRLQFRKSFQVAEFRPNTFEIEVDTSAAEGERKRFSLPVSANYYLGKPLSQARLSWRVSARPTWPRVKGFDDFRFGNAIERRKSFSASDEMELGETGNGLIEFTLPEEKENPAPMRVGISAEITDVNQQTIVENTSFLVESSDFYLGVRMPEGLTRVGEEMTFGLVAANSGGEVVEVPVDAELKIDRLIHHTVKVKGAGGRMTHRTDTERKEVLTKPVSIETRVEPATGLPIPMTTSLRLDEAGDYDVSLTARDEKGRLVLSKHRLRIVGADEPSWSWHDGIKIGLTPDRESYQVGDTAKLLVQSPVLGHALVTVERAGVKETSVRKITEHETVLEIPIRDGAAPNLFASVLIVRGAAQSPHEHPETDYRVGYCQLKVEDPKSALEVAIEVEGDDPYRLPGSEITLGALITDHEGQPVENAEVCLYAVDEGVLSLTGYSTPEPAGTFHRPFPLAVMTGQTLSDLLPEDPRELDFGNKGYVIGGGGAVGDSIQPDRLRKDFRSLAFWRGSLITDAKGRVRTTFQVPDSLTTYRVMAVVCQGNRFGSGEEPLTINQPLMLQPALPAFGNAGDQMDLSAVLHNNTDRPMEIEVRVELDDHADFLPEVEGGLVPANFKKTGIKDEADLRVRRVILPAGKTGKIGFPALFTRKGEAAWRWRAVSLKDPKIVDAVESKLEIGYPMPLLREMLSFELSKKGRSENLVAEVDPRVLSREGEIQVTVSNSRVLEALDALDYLLRYPYGCVEQTTSSTLPWLSTGLIRDAVPQLDRTDAEISEAILVGTRRLLSMQTSEGGLSYWPGGKEPQLWGSAYGGMALALAQKQGVDLPEERLESLWEYLSQQMRNTAKLENRGDLYQRTLTAYTLALAGKAEPSYHELLYGKREQLTRDSRALLALAMMESAGEDRGDATLKKRVTSLLAPPRDGEEEEKHSHWYRHHFSTAMQLLAWSEWNAQDKRTEELLDDLLGVPKGRAAWGSTYLNSWGVLAVTRNAVATASALEGTTAKVSFGKQTREVAFGKELAGELLQFEFRKDSRKVPLTVELDSSAKLYTHVEVAGFPEIVPRDPENHGLGIDRTYHKLSQDGSVSEIDSLAVGDLVLVTLHLAVPENESFHYLAIDDPLPSVFEAVNPNFETQQGGAQHAFQGDWKRLYCNHRELRTERALFFCDYLHRGGHYAVQYLARVVAPGKVTAPPAKIEAMYEPQQFGLSGTLRMTAEPMRLRGKAGSVATN